MIHHHEMYVRKALMRPANYGWIRREQCVVVEAGTALEDEMYACMERDLIRASIHDDTLIY